MKMARQKPVVTLDGERYRIVDCRQPKPGDTWFFWSAGEGGAVVHVQMNPDVNLPRHLIIERIVPAEEVIGGSLGASNPVEAKHILDDLRDAGYEIVEKVDRDEAAS